MPLEFHIYIYSCFPVKSKFIYSFLIIFLSFVLFFFFGMQASRGNIVDPGNENSHKLQYEGLKLDQKAKAPWIVVRINYLGKAEPKVPLP